MWKSGFSLRKTTIFYPQSIVDEITVFHRVVLKKTDMTVFHRKSFHNEQAPVDKFLRVKC